MNLNFWAFLFMLVVVFVLFMLGMFVAEYIRLDKIETKYVDLETKHYDIKYKWLQRDYKSMKERLERTEKELELLREQE